MSAGGHKLTALTQEQRAHFDWLDAPHLKKVVAALEAVETGAARYVGGCVRDSLLGEAPKDFDLATFLTPDVVVSALKKARLGAAPTGIDHGTVTAIADHRGLEVTTLRADVSTDGRRATVAFTRDWSTDAGRRDFRLNAIYLTPDGKLFDPVGGLEDVRNKRVRFIGDPEARIREDYLRILRFFRFTARFSKDFDEPGLAACAGLKTGIGRLSAERVGAEVMAILSLPRAAFALTAIAGADILSEIWDSPADIAALSRLKEIAPDLPAAVGLAALYGQGGDGVGRRLRLSNAEKAIRSKALAGAAEVAPGLADPAARVLAYRFGKEVFADASALACAFGRIDEAEYRRLKALIDPWTVPVLPVSGKHVVAAGVAPGPDVSAILGAVEAQWTAEDFPDEARVMEIFADALAEARARPA